MYDVLRTLRRGARYVTAALAVLALLVVVAVFCRLLDIGTVFVTR